MNPLEIAKEIFGIAANAGLKKDVIDLLDKKVGLLTEEIATLKTENANLKAKVYDLEHQLEQLRPTTSGLDETSEKLLQLLSRPRAPTLEQMARQLGIEQVVAWYHADKLVEKGLIELAGYSPHIGGTVCVLTPKGTAYIVENKLV